MAAQTTFDLDDAKDLLKQLENFHQVMKQDWSRV